ncbi:unnamed protein product, partial [Rotaria sordida]
LRNLFRRYEEEIRNGLKAISKGSRTSEKQMDELFNYFLYCLQPAIRNKIQIYSLESNYDLDDRSHSDITRVIISKISNEV